MKKKSYLSAEQMDVRDRIGLGVWTMHMPERKVAEALVKFGNGGSEIAMGWVKRLERHGVTDTLASEVDRIVRTVKFHAYLKLDHETGRFEPQFETPLAESMSDDKALFAMMVARLVNSEWAYNIKRCELEECRTYFVGNAKARYCHDNCGAKVRAREMRKRNRERQMMI